MSDIRIKQVDDGTWIIEVDGVDLANEVTALKFEADARGQSVLHLDLRIDDLELEGEAEVNS